MTIYWIAVGPYRKKSRAAATFPGEYIYPDSKIKTKFNAICDESAKKLAKNACIVTILIIISFIQILIGPLYAYLIDGRTSTPIGTLLPFATDDSSKSFYINMIHQLVLAIYGCPGSISIEIVSCLFNNVLDLAPELIEHNMKELEINVKITGWNFHRKTELRNILIQIQDLDR